MEGHAVPDVTLQHHEQKFDEIRRDIGKLHHKVDTKMPVGAFILTLVAVAISILSLGGAVINGMWNDTTAYKLKNDLSIMQIAREQVRMSTEQLKFAQLQTEVRKKLGMTE
jgi:hypothetical protein